MKEKLLELTLENDNISLHVGDEDKVVMTLADTIWGEALKYNDKPLSILFSVTVHMLAQDLTGKFEENYIENLRKTIPQYREKYRKLKEAQEN